eukprot:640854-Pyramimonas_sp.AAC.1
MDHPAAAESGPARPRQSGPGRSAVRRGRGVCARVLVGEGAVFFINNINIVIFCFFWRMRTPASSGCGTCAASPQHRTRVHK